MKKGTWSDLHPFIQLLIILILVVTSFIVVSLIGILAAIPFIGFNEVANLLTSDSSVSVLRYLQLIGSIGFFVVPPLIAAWLFSVNPMAWLWFKQVHWQLIIASVILIVATQPLSAWLAHINHSIHFPEALKSIEAWMKSAEESANKAIFMLLDTKDYRTIAFNVFLIAVVPAIGEEMLFRGALQPLVQRLTKNAHLAVWLTAFLFSAMHMQFLTFAPRLILGVIMGYLLVYGKSLWYPVLAHFINNFMSLVVFHYYRVAKPEINPFDPEMGLPQWWLVAGSIAVVIGLMLFIRKAKLQKGYLM